MAYTTSAAEWDTRLVYGSAMLSWNSQQFVSNEPIITFCMDPAEYIADSIQHPEIAQS